jgi:class III poly(R)-hydroxyalkanoic acid synthase PhaE subunit
LNDSPKNADNWLEDWLSTQRKLAAEWGNTDETQRAEATRKMAEALWRGVSMNGSEETKAAARQFGDATQALLAGTGYFMQALTDVSTIMEIPHRAQQMFKAVPLGILREHHIALRSMAQAAEEHQAAMMRMASVFTDMESQAIDLLTQRAQALSDTGKAADNGRALYDLWVDCAEEIFAKLAHDPVFIALLGESLNSFMRLRKRQSSMLEHLLKQFDLPTRAELNSMHRKLKELGARVDALTASEPAKPAPRSKRARPSTRHSSKR